MFASVSPSSGGPHCDQMQDAETCLLHLVRETCTRYHGHDDSQALTQLTASFQLTGCSTYAAHANCNTFTILSIGTLSILMGLHLTSPATGSKQKRYVASYLRTPRQPSHYVSGAHTAFKQSKLMRS